MPGYVFLDATPIDDGVPYFIDWRRADWGSADTREPQVQNTAGGTYSINPIPTAYSARRGTLAIYASAADQLDKRRAESALKGLLSGAHKLHRVGQWLDIYLFGAKEINDGSKTAATVVGVEVTFIAPNPLWSLNQPLNGLVTPVNTGVQWQLWADGTLPAVLPPFTFTTASFTFQNWGTGYAWAAGSITGGPANTTVYLHNTTAGAPITRLAIVLDASGNGTFSSTAHFTLTAGANTLVVENLAGAPITPGAAYLFSLGDTYMRFC